MFSYFRKKTNSDMYLKVPGVCATRRDKNILIEQTIKHLERNIKIKQ